MKISLKCLHKRAINLNLKEQEKNKDIFRQVKTKRTYYQ